MNTVLYIVVPCYNEEDVLPITSKLFLEELQELAQKGKISSQSRVLFVNNFSTDRTWEIIRELADSDPHFLGISQNKNRGHQSNLLAGLMTAKDYCDITISIDCDGQDDIKAIEAMVDAYHDGCEVVYGVRDNRDTDTFLKRSTAQGFYKLLNWMGVEVIYNHGDYRLMSRKALNELAKFKEVNLYLRGMVPLVGFKSTSVYYTRNERLAGKSHYSISKLFGLAANGITSMSIKPIRLIASLGMLISVVSFLMIIYMVIDKLRGNVPVNGWTSTACLICFLSGVQLISLGVIGEYVGKLYMEAKARPRYIISEKTWEENEGKQDDDQ